MRLFRKVVVGQHRQLRHCQAAKYVINVLETREHIFITHEFGCTVVVTLILIFLLANLLIFVTTLLWILVKVLVVEL